MKASATGKTEKKAAFEIEETASSKMGMKKKVDFS
jgi:hypothetical protein